jgi:hypothetical protein
MNSSLQRMRPRPTADQGGVDRPTQRNHQGVANRLLMPVAQVPRSANGNQPIECRERLGG